MYISGALFLSKYWKQILVGAASLIIIFFMLFFNDDSNYHPGLEGDAQVSPLVLRYEPLIRKYAKKYEVENHVQLLMAKMMQESGGRGGDPMQASESLGLPPNTIDDPKKSIKVGVKEYSEVLKEADGDVLMALQAYNFGPGIITYAVKNGGYSQEVAVAFSDMMARRLNWDSYGDVNYVQNVLSYLAGANVGSEIGQNEYGFIRPSEYDITSPFGYRSLGGVYALHAGVDFSCNQQPVPIFAAKSGQVTKAGWQSPGNPSVGYGQRVYIDHGSGMTSIYAHLIRYTVKAGQFVERGQIIGYCGTTGSSTGMHLHFSLEVNGRLVDPIGIVF